MDCWMDWYNTFGPPKAGVRLTVFPAPQTTESRLRDSTDAARVLKRLRHTLHKIDGLFFDALRRSLDLQKSKDIDWSLHRWKLDLRVEEKDYNKFKSLFIDTHPSISDTDYIQDVKRLSYWKMAQDYLVWENERFPGLSINQTNLKTSEDPLGAVLSSGWRKRLTDLEIVALFLVDQIIEVAKHFMNLPEGLLSSLSKQVTELDLILERTRNDDKAGKKWISLGAQIEHAWPKGVPKESFAPLSKVALAYPEFSSMNTSNPATTLIISISSVLGGIFSVVAFFRSTNSPGSIKDADFFSLVQSSVMQISGLGIMTLTLRNISLVKQAKFYVRVLAAFGMLSSVIALPAYVLLPTGWSTIFVAAGEISQAWITLQLVYSVGG